jgi:hypothetical protein
MRRFQLITTSLVFLAILAPAVFAQVATSRLDGMVQDQSGASVPGATVTVVNTKTDAKFTFTVGADGLFVFPSLQPGTYTLTAEAPGFRKAIYQNLALNVSETVSQNIRMEVGLVAETVMVEANAVRVQTSEAQIGRSVTLRDIDVLPQLGRTPIILAVFQAGVQVDPGDVTFSRVNGQRQGSNNSTLDGIDVNDAVVPRLGLSLTANNTDSIGEFRIVTSGGKSEYGRSAGGQIELITRSGTNDWHGGVFDYLRNTVLNANNFFNNASIPSVARPIFIQNIFGGLVGGPIRRDKTFIFGNYQGRRTTQTTVRNRTVLTPEAKRGLFRWKAPAAGSPIQTFDILANDPRKLGIDPKVADVLKLLPDPNNTDLGDALNTAGFRFNNPSGSLEDQFTIRADHYLTSNHRVWYRHSWQRNSSIDALNNADTPFPAGVQGTQGGHRWGLAAGSDWTISPTIVNELRYGHQSASVAFNRPQRLKGPALLPNTYTNPILANFAQGRNSPVDEYTDHITFVRKAHTIKTGANFRRVMQYGYDDAGIYPNVSFTTGNGNSVPATIGPSGASVISSADRQRFDDLYNDLLGRMNQVTQTFYSNLQTFQPAGAPRVRNYIFNELGLFAQDDWKLKPYFTLNFGFRWEFFGIPHERDGFQGTVDKIAQINAVANIDSITVQRSSDWYKHDWNNFAPRIGFAWDLTHDGKTSLRGAYGIFYDRIIGAVTSTTDSNTPGFSQQVPVFPNQSGSSDVRVNGGLQLPAQPAAPVLTLPATRSTTISLLNPNLRTGYVHQYSLNLQRELFKSTVFDIGYVGARGVKLFTLLNVNQRKVSGDYLQAFRELQAFSNGGANNGPAPSPNNTLVRIFGSPAAAVTGMTAAALRDGLAGSAADTLDRGATNFGRYAGAGVSPYYVRNFPQFDQVRLGGNDGRNYFDSLQFSVRRSVGSLRLFTNYTFSKSIDNISVDSNGYTAPIDNINFALNKGRGDADRPHSFNASAIYTLPIGRGHRLAGNAPRWVDTLIGGWDLGMLNFWQSGPVMTVSSGRQTAGTSANTWANYTGDRSIGSVDRKGNGVFFLTPEQIAQFTFPAAGEIGSSGRNAFRGPRAFNIDMSLVKHFRLTERFRIDYRCEAYNLLNNVNFNTPGLSIATAQSFGKISGTIGNPRIFQMAMRLDF